MNTVIENLTRDYFLAFNLKDSAELSRMFDDNVELVDWEVNVKGKGPMLANNQQLFNTVKTIKVIPEIIAVYGTTSLSRISVKIDEVTIKVVDVITFNNAGKIIRIEAYRQ